MANTILWILDPDQTTESPTSDSGPFSFPIYNDAMSYAKFLNYRVSSSLTVWIWNHDGGSGYWRGGTWTARENMNYPS